MSNAFKLLRSLLWDAHIRTQDNCYANAICSWVAKCTDFSIAEWNAFALPLADDVRRNGSSLRGSEAACLLQVLDLFKKAPGNRREDVVIERFLNEQTRVGAVHLRSNWVKPLRRIIRYWLSDSIGTLEECRHGPGATAEKALWDDKYYQLRFRPARAESLWNNVVDPLGRLKLVRTCDVPSRVLVVDKDCRGGRLIAAEQASLQFLQQGIGRAISEKLVSRAGMSCLRNRDIHIAFLRQRMSDRTTVDLHAASDFVSMPLIASILPKEWMRAVAMTRSPKLSVQGRLMTTKTVALMGNGYCFAMLSLVCAACCALVTGDIVANRSWSVFGDDIVIDDRYYHKLRFVLTACGLVVNDDKTYRPEHPFAETCGTDIWRSDLTNVRPKYLRAPVDGSVSINDLPKLCEFQRYLATRCHWQASEYMRHRIMEIGLNLTGRRPISIPYYMDIQGGLYVVKHRSDDMSDIESLTHRSSRYHVLTYLDLRVANKSREANLAEGESWAKAFHNGALVAEETLARDGVWQFKRSPCILL